MSANRQRKPRAAQGPQQDPQEPQQDPQGEDAGAAEAPEAPEVPEAPEGAAEGDGPTGDGDPGVPVELAPDPVDVQAAQQARAEEIASLIEEQYEPLKTPPPATGPLDAPAGDAGQALTSGQVPTAAESAAVSAVRRREAVLDATTGQTPDVEGLFVPVVPGGTLYTCTRRLLRETQVNYHHKTVVLLVPQGAQVSVDFVTRITALLKDQQG